MFVVFVELAVKMPQVSSISLSVLSIHVSLGTAIYRYE